MGEHAAGAVGLGNGQPVDLAGHEVIAEQGLLFPHHDGAGLGPHGQHVERTARGQAQPASLANGEPVNAAVPADLPTGGVHDWPLAFLGRRLSLDEGRIVTVRDEADFLALGLVRHWQITLAGQPTHVLFLQFAHREKRQPQLLLGEAEEKVRLVFVAIAPAEEGGSDRPPLPDPCGRSDPWRLPRPREPGSSRRGWRT